MWCSMGRDQRNRRGWPGQEASLFSLTLTHSFAHTAGLFLALENKSCSRGVSRVLVSR